MSERAGLMTSGQAREDLEFLRSDGGIDVYLDKSTGQEVYLGRTSRGH